MVKKSLKRFHIHIRHYYYLVIKFLKKTGSKTDFTRMYIYQILLIIIIYTETLSHGSGTRMLSLRIVRLF